MHLPYEIKKAIETRTESILHDIIWMIDRDEITDISGCHRFIDEAHVDETDVCHLSLDQQWRLLGHQAEDYGFEIHATCAGDIRRIVETLAAELAYYLAMDKARCAISELDELLKLNDLEFEDVASENPFAWAAHRAERDEDGCQVYVPERRGGDPRRRLGEGARGRIEGLPDRDRGSRG